MANNTNKNHPFVFPKVDFLDNFGYHYTFFEFEKLDDPAKNYIYSLYEDDFTKIIIQMDEPIEDPSDLVSVLDPDEFERVFSKRIAMNKKTETHAIYIVE